MILRPRRFELLQHLKRKHSSYSKPLTKQSHNMQMKRVSYTCTLPIQPKTRKDKRLTWNYYVAAGGTEDDIVTYDDQLIATPISKHHNADGVVVALMF